MPDKKVAGCGCTYHLQWVPEARDENGGSHSVRVDQMCPRHANAPSPPGYWGNGWTAKAAAEVAISREPVQPLTALPTPPPDLTDAEREAALERIERHTAARRRPRLGLFRRRAKGA